MCIDYGNVPVLPCTRSAPAWTVPGAPYWDLVYVLSNSGSSDFGIQCFIEDFCAINTCADKCQFLPLLQIMIIGLTKK